MTPKQRAQRRREIREAVRARKAQSIAQEKQRKQGRAVFWGAQVDPTKPL